MDIGIELGSKSKTDFESSRAAEAVPVRHSLFDVALVTQRGSMTKQMKAALTGLC